MEGVNELIMTNSMLDTIIFETIPSPSLLVMANSLTFSIGVSRALSRTLCPLVSAKAPQGLGRAIGPFVISYVFSLSTHFASSHPLRQLVWVVFAGIGLPGVWLAWEIVSRGRGHESLKGKEGEGEEEERVELISRGERV